MDPTLDERLFHAARSDDASIVRDLLAKGASILYRDARTGWTALHFVAEHNSLEAAKTLLEHHVPIDVLSADGWTALAVAVDAAIDDVCQNGGSLDLRMVQMLFAAGANPDAFEPPGESAIKVATAYRANDVLAVLTRR